MSRPETPRVALVTGAGPWHRGGHRADPGRRPAGRCWPWTAWPDDPALPLPDGQPRRPVPGYCGGCPPGLAPARCAVHRRRAGPGRDRGGRGRGGVPVGRPGRGHRAAGVIARGVPLWQMPAGQQQAVLDVDLGGVLDPGPGGHPGTAPPPGAAVRAVPGRGLGRGHPRAAYAGRVLRGQSGSGRADPRAGCGTGRQRGDRERGQPGLDRHPDPGRERPAVRPARGGRVRSASSRCAACSTRPRWPPCSPSWPARGSSGMTGAVVPVDGGLAL